jgi:hypothetical protein
MKIKTKKILLIIPIVMLIISTTIVVAHGEGNVDVKVNASDFVSDRFEVTIEIRNVTDLTSGQFDLSFDPDVIQLDDVEPGSIDGTRVPIEMWHLVDDGKVRILLKLPDAGLVSGSGDLATINFEVVGNDGDTSDLEISDAELFSYISRDSTLLGSNTELEEIDADWSGNVVTVGDMGTVKTGRPAETSVQTSTFTSRPPPTSIPTSLTPAAEPAAASTPATEYVADAAVPVGTSEKDGPDPWKMIAANDFIEIYSFIGLLAFVYTLTLLK